MSINRGKDNITPFAFRNDMKTVAPRVLAPSRHETPCQTFLAVELVKFRASDLAFRICNFGAVDILVCGYVWIDGAVANARSAVISPSLIAISSCTEELNNY